VRFLPPLYANGAHSLLWRAVGEVVAAPHVAGVGLALEGEGSAAGERLERPHLMAAVEVLIGATPMWGVPIYTHSTLAITIIDYSGLAL